MNIDDFQFDDFIKENNEDNEIKLIKKIITFVCEEWIKNGSKDRIDVRNRLDILLVSIKKIMYVYISIGVINMEICALTSFKLSMMILTELEKLEKLEPNERHFHES